MTGPAAALNVVVKTITLEAEDTISLDLRPIGQQVLPVFTAGAHIDVLPPGGITRSYSLVNDQRERHRYVIAIYKDPASRGGSRFIHETIRVGDVLSISPPRDHFSLVESAVHSVLIAGGIGITPILAMVRRLAAQGRAWTLLYAARTRQRAAFLEEIGALATAGEVRFHFDDERAGIPPELSGLVWGAPAGTHFYCCGPAPMLSAFETACAAVPPARVHMEYFANNPSDEPRGGFEVVLARSGRTIVIPEGSTILDTLLAEGVDVGYSCLEGVCGTCETGVLEGIPDHKDVVLSEQERASNRTIMICCSGSKSERLTLDL